MDTLSGETIRKRLDYWTWLVGPKFSKKDREAINLSRHYSLQQVEYCRNLIFRRNSYRLTDKGNKVALLFVLFHKRVCGPLANSLFNKPPQSQLPPPTKIEAAYRRADQSIQQVIELLAA